jgi:uncharacterized alpha-E superfamily protein
MFRRTAGVMVSGPAALRFLLRDPQFPRSVERCLIAISQALLELTGYDVPMAGCADVQQLLESTNLDTMTAEGLHEYVDELQSGLASLHALLASTYFQRAPAAAADTVLLPT